jgi:dTDP-4-dehydrorhamnose reductase
VAVREALGDNALVLRTSWVYAGHGRNFLLTMLRLMRERSELRVVEDQVGTPTSAASLARVVLAAVAGGVVGTHHWTDAGVASWYDFALAIQEEGARAGLDTSRCRVLPIPTDEYPTPARRPACSLLDKTGLRSASGITGRHWREELREVLRAVAGQGSAAG